MTDQVRKQVKKILIDRDITQTRLASEIGKGRTTVSSALSGKVGTVAPIWQAILDGLGVELVIREKEKASN